MKSIFCTFVQDQCPGYTIRYASNYSVALKTSPDLVIYKPSCVSTTTYLLSPSPALSCPASGSCR